MVKDFKIKAITMAYISLAIAFQSLSLAAQTSIKDILSKPGVAEQMQANYAGKGTYDGQQDTPLVIQAKQFALRINPPPPPPPPNPTPQERQPIRPKEVSANFKLLGTSYKFGDEAHSWALIDEVGKGIHWVKQGGTVGYLKFEKIGDGGVLINDNGRKYELQAERQTKPDLVKSYSGSLEKKEPIVLMEGGEKVTGEPKTPEPQPPTPTNPPEPPLPPQQPQPVQLTPEEQLKATQENLEWLKKMQSESNSAGVSAGEANQLSGLGEMMKALEQEAKQLQEQQQAQQSQPKADANVTDSKPKTEPNKPQGPKPSAIQETNTNQQTIKSAPPQPPASEAPKTPNRLRRIRDRK